MASDKPVILHLTADFPDPVQDRKTPVIRTLVDLSAAHFNHRVISLNRVEPSLGALVAQALSRNRPVVTSREPFDYGDAVRYAAPGKGLFHATMLHRLGDWLAERLSDQRLPDLLVAHKLTIEGIAVRRASARLGIPFAISMQGNTDARILRMRPDLHSEFRAIFHEARTAFPFAPWTLRRFEQAFGQRSLPTVLLPCPTDLDEPIPPQLHGDGFVSVFHLQHHRLKNLAGMVAAVRALRNAGAPVTLAIAGGGAEADIARCRTITGGEPGIRLTGALDRQAVRAMMNRATGFVLPSLSESFGLVFVEALFAGVPIIYPAGRAVDGYFDGLPFAIAVRPDSPQEIAEAMRHVAANEARLKAELAAWQQSENALRFTRGRIGLAFRSGIETALNLAGQ